MSELLPCPFCGGEAELTTKKMVDGGVGYRYRCSKCHAAIGQWSGGVEGSPWAAAESWNMRHEFHGGKLWKVAESCYFKMEPGNPSLWKCMSCNCHVESIGHEPLYNYCPNCGAKVVGE